MPHVRLVPVVAEVDKQDILVYYEVFEDGVLSKEFPRIGANKLAEFINAIVKFRENGTRPFVFIGVQQSDWPGLLSYEFDDFYSRFLNLPNDDALLNLLQNAPF